MRASLKAWPLARLLFALLAAGCQRDCRYDEEPDFDARVEEDLYVPDAGRGMDGGASSDGGAMHDGGTFADGGARDAGPGRPADGGLPSDGGERDGGGLDGEVLCPGSAPIPVGSSGEPRPIAYSSLPFSGYVDWRGLAFLRVSGLAPGQRYVVTLDGPDDLQLLVYPDDDSFAFATCSDLPYLDMPASCPTVPTHGSLAIAIDAERASGAFELDVRPLDPNLSPADDPLHFSATELPVLATAVPMEVSIYQIDDLVPGQQYVFKALGADELIGFGVRTGPEIDAPILDVQTGRAPEVVATPAGTTLQLALISSVFGTEVELAHAPAAFVSEGSASAPVTVTAGELTGLEGSIAAVATLTRDMTPTRSYYAVTGLAPGAYDLRMTADPGIAVLGFGDDATYTSEAQCEAVSQEDARIAECGVVTTGSTLYFAAWNTGGDGSQLRFELAPASYPSEGSLAEPLEQPIGVSGWFGYVAPYGLSHYRLVGATPGAKYRFEFAEAAGGMLVASFFRPGEEHSPLCTFVSTDEVAQCVVTARDAVIDMHVSTSSSKLHSDVGGTFVMSSERVPEQVAATASSPIRVDCGRGVHRGQVGPSGESYYEVSGLSPGVAYMFEVFDLDAPFDLALSSDGSFRGEVVCGEGGAQLPARCKRRAGDDGQVTIRVRSPVTAPFSLRVTAAMSGSEGRSSEPFEVAYSQTPYVGRVAAEGPSYYAITGLVAGQQYALRVASEQEIVQLDLHWPSFDGAQLLAVSALPGFPTDTSFIARADVAYITMSLQPEADGVTAFSLEVTPMH